MREGSSIRQRLGKKCRRVLVIHDPEELLKSVVGVLIMNAGQQVRKQKDGLETERGCWEGPWPFRRIGRE